MAEPPRIGLIATSSTSYYEPYNLARLFASLDHLSAGRAGWNIVTTSTGQASENFGLAEQASHAERYARAAEFVDVVTKLWDSWEDGAFLGDAASGLFADDARIHPINHVGPHFRVKGPLNIARNPQGRPVYVQAGSATPTSSAGHAHGGAQTDHELTSSPDDPMGADHIPWLKLTLGVYRDLANGVPSRCSMPSSPRSQV